MKAAVVKGVRKIEVEEVPTPSVLPGTLLLKTIYCGICGSDLEYLDGSFGLPKAGTILGHEYAAEVAAVGEGVKGWSVGDRVAPGRRECCGHCYFCRRGLYRLCFGNVSPRALLAQPPLFNEETPEGYENKLGAMAEYFVRPTDAVQKVADTVSDEEACMAEPLATGLNAAKAAELKPGDSAVVIGAGKIGLGAIICAKAAGASPVIAIDMIKSRLDKALEVGADVALNAKEVDIISEVVKLTEAGPDAVLICVLEGKVLNQAVDMVRRGGTVVVAGSIPPVEINPLIWMVKQVRVEGILGEYGQYGSTITSMNLIAHKQVNVNPLISEIMPLEEVQRAFDSKYSGETIAVLLKP